MQLHNLVEPDEWQKLPWGPAARSKRLSRPVTPGLVRFIGVTGHGSEVAASPPASLERFV